MFLFALLVLSIGAVQAADQDLDPSGILLKKGELMKHNNYGYSEEDNNELNCECVPFYLCGANGQIITDGSSGGLAGASPIIEEKLGASVYNVHTCPEKHYEKPDVCCRLPMGFTVPTCPGPQEHNPEGPPLTQPHRKEPPQKEPHKVPDEPVTPVHESTTPEVTLCGTVLIDERIVQGEDTVFGEFPWMAMILEKKENANIVYGCGASIIHPHVVLTAAHCVRGIDHDKLIIRAGDHITDSIDISMEPLPHQDRNVQEIVLPNAFNPNNLVNDLALLVLTKSLTYASNIGTVCLPPHGVNYENTEYCVATGWGRKGHVLEEHNEFPKKLKKAVLDIVTAVSCQQELRETRLGKYFSLDESFLCAKGKTGEDTCQGDGGGPLVCTNKDGHFVQTGVTSWGIGCSGRSPGVYTNLGYSRHWIDEQMLRLGFEVNGGFKRH